MIPPLIKGGQGRSSEQVERDGTPSVLTLLAVVSLLALLVAGALS